MIKLQLEWCKVTNFLGMKMMFTYNLLRRTHEIVAHQAGYRPEP